MRILWVRHHRLLPVRGGGMIRTYFTVRELARRHEVKVISFYFGAVESEYESALAVEFPGADAIRLQRRRRKGPLGRLMRQLTSLPPYYLDLNVPDATMPVQSAIDSGKFDIAVCDGLQAAMSFPTDLSILSVLFEHNLEWDYRRQEISKATTVPKRLLRTLEAWRMKNFERRQVERFHHTVAVSEADATGLRELAPRRAITAIRTGVDLDHYQPTPLTFDASPLALFTGIMSYSANVDAVEWFCRAIWPEIVAAVPAARFRIVGRRPSRSVMALASGRVEVTGEVESVGEHFREASVVVVPLRMGSGTRLKIYEAMACGRPVVSTTLGAAGLEVHAGKDIVIADDARSFADEVIALLRTPKRAQGIAACAAETGGAHSWPEVVRDFERVLEHVVAGGYPPQE